MEELSKDSGVQEVIIPTEFKLCATCSFWDGERRVDEEIGVVVVCKNSSGQCLSAMTEAAGLHIASSSPEADCGWETLFGDPIDKTLVDEIYGKGVQLN